MSKPVRGELRIQNFDDLYGTETGPESKDITMVRISELHAFREHPFRVVDDDRMKDLVDSIKTQGVLTPIIVREKPEGGYELISGHRRSHAAELAGLYEIPAIVKELTDDEATILMVDSNIQREEILPSERAFAFKMKMDAMRRQGARMDLTCRHNVDTYSQDGEQSTCGHDVDTCSQECVQSTCRQDVDRLYGEKTATTVGKTIGVTGRTVHRYIRLTELIPELLELVDRKILPMVQAVDISYISAENQRYIYDELVKGKKLKPKEIARMKEVDENDESLEGMIDELIAAKATREKERTLVLPMMILKTYFDEDVSASDMESVIYDLLAKWKEERAE